MTLAIFVDEGRSWGVLKHYLATGLSAAVLVTVAVAGATMTSQPSDAPASRAPVKVVGAQAAPPPTQSLVTYYLVESEEQAEMLRQAEAYAALERSVNGTPDVEVQERVVFVVDTPEGLRSLDYILSAGMVAGTGIEPGVIDLRGR